MKKIVNIKRDPVIVDTDTCDIKALPTQCRGLFLNFNWIQGLYEEMLSKFIVYLT